MSIMSAYLGALIYRLPMAGTPVRNPNNIQKQITRPWYRQINSNKSNSLNSFQVQIPTRIFPIGEEQIAKRRRKQQIYGD